jgi:acetyl esterase/lipase
MSNEQQREETEMWRAVGVAMLAAAMITAAAEASAREYEVTTRNDVVYVERDGAKLVGDLYLPKGLDKAPVLVAVHGGGWQRGSREIYKYWGPYLAKNGYGVFAIEYRLMKPGFKTYPGAAYDVKAAIQFVRAKAGELNIDAERIALVGDSAGAHLSALVALAQNEPPFAGPDAGNPNASLPAAVKAVIGFYGVYDMAAQWEHDQIARPNDQITAKFLGAPPFVNRKVYFEGSPISYATVDKRGPRFLLIHGTADDIVDPATQSTAFLTALKQAGFFVRTIVVPGAGHFWTADPVEEPGSYGAYAAPKLLRFLADAL